VGLIATLTSEAKPDSDSEDENEQWVPKSEFVKTADMSKSKRKAKIMVP